MVAVAAAAGGEFVMIPPGYGHVSINSGEEVLVMANLVSTRFASEYALYEELQGGAYYKMEGNGWVMNPRYPMVSSFREMSARDAPGLGGIQHGMDMYDLVSGSADLSFLNEPEKIADR